MSDLDPPHERIRNLAASYCTLIDARADARALSELFTADALLVSDREIRGRDAIAAFYEQVFASTLLLRHHTANPSVELVSATSAVHRCYYVAVVVRRRAADVVLGNYTDLVELDSGQWRFAERRSDAVAEIPLDAALLARLSAPDGQT